MSAALGDTDRQNVQQTAGSVRRLVIFISYASEDNQLAIALYHMLNNYFGQDFAEVLIDTESFRQGISLNESIRELLNRTDVLVTVYTGQAKPSHSFTGIELGYFLGLSHTPGSPARRRIIPFYRQTPPEAAAGLLGVRFGIEKNMLQLTVEDYQRRLQDSVNLDHPVAAFLKNLEDDVNAMRRAARHPDARYSERDRLESVRNFLVTIFSELRKAVDFENAPQNKLVIHLNEKLGTENFELPNTAKLVPEGAGTMAIFGLPEREIFWQDFLRNTNTKYRNAWKDAIETVVISSLEGGNTVDNSQIVISNNSLRQVNLYRVVLSRSILFYDNRREFHLYFVEVARRNDFGNPESTRLLKALGLCCRFRFMFFEEESQFSEEKLKLKFQKFEIKEWARNLIRELNLMKRDALEAALDSAESWRFIVNFDALFQMHVDYAPLEARIYTAAERVLASEDFMLSTEKEALIEAIKDLRVKFHDRNAQLIRDLGNAVSRLPETPTPARNNDNQ